jgi:hypothetical protein
MTTSTTATTTLLSPERIFLEALHAVGAMNGDEPASYAAKVASTADLIQDAWRKWSRRQMSVAGEFRGTGTVLQCEDDVISESGRPLDLFRVTVRGDSGTRPDRMWIDKRDAAGVALFGAAQALVGKHVRFHKEQRVQWNGDDPALDNDGNPITRPYLVAIAADAAVETPANADAGGQQPPSGGQPAPAPAPNAQSAEQLIALRPQSPTALVGAAVEHLGMTPDAVKQEVEAIIGPKQPGVARTRADLLKAWTAIVYAHCS